MAKRESDTHNNHTIFYMVFSQHAIKGARTHSSVWYDRTHQQKRMSKLLWVNTALCSLHFLVYPMTGRIQKLRITSLCITTAYELH